MTQVEKVSNLCAFISMPFFYVAPLYAKRNSCLTKKRTVWLFFAIRRKCGHSGIGGSGGGGGAGVGNNKYVYTLHSIGGLIAH